MSIAFYVDWLFRPKRMKRIKAFAELIQKTKTIASIYECQEAMVTVKEFHQTIPEGDELVPYIGRLVEFIIDTRIHAEKGCHASQYTEWKTCYTFPDINNYFSFNHKIEHFS